MYDFRTPLAAILIILGLTGGTLQDESVCCGLDRVSGAPLGLPDVPVPRSNPPTSAKISLGQKLFFDARLSADGSLACSSCHKPQEAFTETSRTTPVGTNHRSLPRNAPSIVNAAFMRHLMQDGEAPSFETQILTPLFSPEEMGNPSIVDFVRRITLLPDYAGSFENAFGKAPSIANIGEAIASYERTLLSANSRFDRWHFGGNNDALNAEAKLGYALFTGKAGCFNCHSIGSTSALFTDQDFHNTGIAARSEKTHDVDVPVDLGRQSVTHEPADHFKYRTPTLRNVERTAPYMHDGSLASLEAVVRYYNAGGTPNSGLDPKIRPLGLSDMEVAALVAFLDSLTGDNLGELASDARRPPRP